MIYILAYLAFGAAAIAISQGNRDPDFVHWLLCLWWGPVALAIALLTRER